MKAKDTMLKMFCRRTERHKRAESGEKGYIPYHLFLGMGIAVVLLFAGIGTVGATADYYVATWGCDDNKGTSVDEPWQHPSYAAQQAQAGDTIYLIDGTWYDEHIVFANSGNATHHITITAYNGTPTLDGVDDTGYGIDLGYQRKYINIIGVAIRDYARGIASDTGARHINIKNVTITSTPGFSIHFLPNCRDITVDNVNITHNEGTGGAIVFQGYSATNYNLSVINSRFDDNRHDAINIHTNAENVLIENNTIYDASYGAGIMIHNYGCKNIIIRNNTIIDSTRGIQLSGVEDAIVENNTILNSHSENGILIMVYSDPEDTIKNVTIRNNVVKNSISHDILLYVSSTMSAAGKEISDIHFENNTVEKTFRCVGSNIHSITIKNIPDATRTLIIDNAVSNLQIEFDTDETFKLNGDEGGHTSATLTEVGTYIIEVEGAVSDTTPPYTLSHSPAKNANGISKDTNIILHIIDNSAGVDESSIIMTVEEKIVSPTITGTVNDYTLTYAPSTSFNYNQVVDIIIDARDLAGNDMPQDRYSFTIESEGGLVAYWKLDQGSGTTAYDSSGNNNDGTIHSGSWIEEGKVGTALVFDGLDDYVSIPNSPTLNPAAEITLIAWVNPGVIPQAGWNKIIAKPYTNSTSPWQQYALVLHDNQFVFELNTEGAKDAIASTETVEPDTWYHVTGTYDGSEMRIYVNAALNGTMPKSGAIVAYPTDVHIGAGIYSDAETEYITGTIDEVKIYSRALSAEEIRKEIEESSTPSVPSTNATIIPAPNDEGWNNVTPVVVTAFRSDNDSGISYTNYSKTSETGPWTTVDTATATGPDAENVTAISESRFNVTVSDEGTTQIWYYSVDSDSHVEHVKDVTVKIDTTATGIISGIVTNTTNNAPIQGATVTVEGTLKSAETDANGVYTLTDVPINTYTVTCTASGYQDSYQSDIKVNESETTQVIFALISSTITPLGDLAGEWRFEEGTGEAAVDTSGNENNGIIHSGSWTEEGKVGTALKFDGLDDYVSIPNSPALNPADEITLIAWVNPGVIPQAGWNKIIAKPYTNSSYPWQQYALTLHDNQFVFELNTEGAKDTIASTETLEPDTWYHVTGTYDGLEMRIYVNAALNGTMPKSGAIAAYPTNVHIGAGIYSDAETEYINGTIDEVKIYNRALSAEEIRADYKAVSPVGLWRFDKGAGGVAVDSSGNENNGIIHGSANWTAGKLDSALEFDGLDDYVRIPNSPTLNPAEEITLLAWVNPGVIPQEGYRKIIAKPYTNYTTPWQQYALTLHDNQFVFELNTEGTKDAIASTETLEPNTWYHVTGTYDGSEMRIYVNAALNGTIQKSGAIAAYPTDMHIGAGIYTDAETEYITGTLDEVKIYNRALSADEIQADYEVGLSDTSGTISGTVTTLDSVGIANAAVTLTTLEGAEIVTTQTDINGNYTFEDIAPGVYNLSVSKLRFWPTTITVNTGDALSEDIMLWLKGDLNLNGESGDSDDLIMMDYAATGGLIPDWKFDLNTNGEFACAGDVLMLEEAAAGKIELL